MKTTITNWPQTLLKKLFNKKKTAPNVACTRHWNNNPSNEERILDFEIQRAQNFELRRTSLFTLLLLGVVTFFNSGVSGSYTMKTRLHGEKTISSVAKEVIVFNL